MAGRPRGFHHSMQTKQKISKALKGRGAGQPGGTMGQHLSRVGGISNRVVPRGPLKLGRMIGPSKGVKAPIKGNLPTPRAPGSGVKAVQKGATGGGGLRSTVGKHIAAIKKPRRLNAFSAKNQFRTAGIPPRKPLANPPSRMGHAAKSSLKGPKFVGPGK